MINRLKTDQNDTNWICNIARKNNTFYTISTSDISQKITNLIHYDHRKIFGVGDAKKIFAVTYIGSFRVLFFIRITMKINAVLVFIIR